MRTAASLRHKVTPCAAGRLALVTPSGQCNVYMAAPSRNTIIDWDVSAGSALRHHQVALCLLLALSASDSVIMQLLPGLTPGQLSMLKANRIITAACADYKDRFLGENANEQFQRYMPKVFETFAEALNDDTLKIEKRLDAAKWVAEKVTGKARQEIELDGGATILSLLQALDERKAQREVGPVRTIAGVTQAARDPLAEWVASHVPESLTAPASAPKEKL